MMRLEKNFVMKANQKNKQTSSSTSRLQKPPPDESIEDEEKSDLRLGELRFWELTRALRWTGGFYLAVLASFCIAYIGWQIVPSTEILILMTLPGYVITTIIGAIVGSAIDR